VFVWPEELLFYTSLSSPFCVVDLTNHRRQQAPHTDLKKIKNKERSLSLSRAFALSSLPRKALFEVRERRFFSLSKNCRRKKADKKIQNLRAGALARARAGRERERRATDFRTNRTFFSLAVRFVFVFRVRGEGEEETHERERGQRFVYLTLLTLY